MAVDVVGLLEVGVVGLQAELLAVDVVGLQEVDGVGLHNKTA